jgi:NAD-dependent deacetylase
MNPFPGLQKKRSFEEAKKADLLLIIGTNAEVLPAAEIPEIAKKQAQKSLKSISNPRLLPTRLPNVFIEACHRSHEEIGKELYL